MMVSEHEDFLFSFFLFLCLNVHIMDSGFFFLRF